MSTAFIAAATFAQVLCGSVPQEDSAPLMERVARDDQVAFAELVRAQQQRVVRYCARFVGDIDIASELTQEVFLVVWNERKRYRERGKLEHYLLRVARHRCLAFTKKRANRRRLRERWQLPETNIDGAPSEARHLDRALSKLKPEIRDLVILRHLEELELSEIAKVTGLKLGTIKSRLSRALAVLRKELANG